MNEHDSGVIPAPLLRLQAEVPPDGHGDHVDQDGTLRKRRASGDESRRKDTSPPLQSHQGPDCVVRRDVGAQVLDARRAGSLETARHVAGPIDDEEVGAALPDDASDQKPHQDQRGAASKAKVNEVDRVEEEVGNCINTRSATREHGGETRVRLTCIKHGAANERSVE